jgi:hypothetical protein
MRIVATFRSLAGLSALALTAACGTVKPTTSATKQRIDIPSQDVDAQAAAKFIAHANEIVAAGSGHFAAFEIADILPLDDRGMTDVTNAYANGFDVTCAAGALCQMHGTGRAVEAVVHSTSGSVSNPTLGLRTSLTSDFALVGENTIEFCGMNGMYVKKLFITQNLQGLNLNMAGREPSLTVNTVGSDDYTCK